MPMAPCDDAVELDLTESPASPMLSHDRLLVDGYLDVETWLRTLFLPVLVLTEEGNMLYETEEDARGHLSWLSEVAQQSGTVGLRTRIVSTRQTGDDIALVTTLRDRVSADDQVIGTTSITWTVIRDQNEWKISQIHFNDARLDPSLVAQMNRSEGTL